MNLGTHPMASIQKNGNKRRFSDEQIKFLECMFDSESRPESLIKQQLASELGLQPRQVAIWFQNRRARLKNKQIEREYNILKANYDALASSLESLKQENQSLLTQLQKLKNLHIKHDGSRKCEVGQTDSGIHGRFKNRSTDLKSKEKHTLTVEGCGHKEGMPSSDHNSRNIESTAEEIDVMNLTEHTEGSLTSSDLHSFKSNCFLDESTCSSEWWELLS